MLKVTSIYVEKESHFHVLYDVYHYRNPFLMIKTAFHCLNTHMRM